MQELYKKYRLKSLKRIIGQEGTVTILSVMIKNNKVPHAILFAGESGCGKTTIARILSNQLNCSKHDFNEINCADFRGIDMVRDIRKRMLQSPIDGSCRVWLIDECHKLSNDAQNAFLKILEDTPKHVYFFLATTLPQKLLKTIQTRCTVLNVSELTQKETISLITYICKKEKKVLSEEVMESIAEHSEGSPRKALFILNQIIDIKEEDDQLNAVSSVNTQKQAIEIARALMRPKTNWKEMAIILQKVKEDPESLRYMILGYANAILLKSGNARAYLLIEALRDNFYDSKKAGLSAACYEVVAGT